MVITEPGLEQYWVLTQSQLQPREKGLRETWIYMRSLRKSMHGLTWPVTVQLCIGICKETHTKAFKLFHFNFCPRSSFGSEHRVEAHFVPMSARIWSLTECTHKTRVQDFQRVIRRAATYSGSTACSSAPPLAGGLRPSKLGVTPSLL